MRAKVLLVDDDPLITDTLQRVLHDEDCDFLTATSGAEALAVLETEVVDVIVSDEQMPRMKGTEFLKIAKEKYPNTVRILLTGHPDVATALKAINEDEVYRFVTKPVDAVGFAVTLRLAVEKKRLIEHAQQLLRRYRQKRHVLENVKKQALEDEYPGITKVDLDEKGLVNIGEEVERMDYRSLIGAIRKELRRD